MASSIRVEPRRFEFVGRSAGKFWGVQVIGREVAVRFGRFGTVGQTRSKILADPAAADRHAESLIRGKVRKGYAEVTGFRAA